MEKQSSDHPPTSVMVLNALKTLHERRGVSFYAVKQYVFSSYKVDPKRITPFIKRYLDSAISNGTVVRTKGTGMAASFKLAPVKPAPKKKTESAGAPPKSQSATEKSKVTKPAIKTGEGSKSKTHKTREPKSATDMPASVASTQKMKKRKISITATKIRKTATKG